jgi:hypothetical protein
MTQTPAVILVCEKPYRPQVPLEADAPQLKISVAPLAFESQFSSLEPPTTGDRIVEVDYH